MKIYISGSITNDKKYKARFNTAEKKLVAKGHEVINPAVYIEKEKNKVWLDYMIDALCVIKNENPDAIYLLKGWQISDGANIERIVFRHDGKKIMTEREDG